MSNSALVLGGGVMGLTAAIELCRRGWQVTLLEAGAIPHPDAASTDISKVVRMDYGSDPLYTEMGEQALLRWREWNGRWGEPLFHEDGFLVMSRSAMQPGSFEHDSHEFLSARGHALVRVGREDLRQRYPQWQAERFAEGYFNPAGGWAESGRVVARLREEALEAGIALHEGVRFQALLVEHERVTGLRDTKGRAWCADVVVSALGAWTSDFLPWLEDLVHATAQPVFHFAPPDPDAWRAPEFPVWAADIASTGWYGFPANADGIVKVANHGPGRRVHASEPRQLPAHEEARFRAFLRETFPALASAPVVGTRVCLYGDSFDGHFLIDQDPEHPGLVIAAGDSGHAFKFTPLLGGLIADAVEGRWNPWRERFRWRKPVSSGTESARAGGDTVAAEWY